MTKQERPRCPMCNKLIRPWTERVSAPTNPKTYTPVSGWRYTGNGHVVAREYHHILVSPDGKEEVERFLDEVDYSRGDIYDRQFIRTDRMQDAKYTGWTYDKRLRHVSVWDGESYHAKDGFFCSGTCAGNFARAAYRAGYRIKQRSAA